MIDILIGALPGLVAALAVWLIATGVRLYRSDALDDVNPEELIEGALLAAETRSSVGPIARLGRRFVPTIRQVVPRAALRRLQRLIDLAGRPKGVDVDSVLSSYAGAALLAIPVGVFYATQGQGIVVVLLVALVVLFPVLRLVTAARRRRERINKDLPDFLDVLAVTVSAGLGFRSALGMVAGRFGGPLGEEVTTTLHQIANGASVRSAFKNMRVRTNSESVDEFVTAYLQAEELGAPLVEALNQIALDLRSSAAQRALQQAAGVAPRMTLVTTLVMVPGTLILIVIALFIGSNVDFAAVLGG